MQPENSLPGSFSLIMKVHAPPFAGKPAPPSAVGGPISTGRSLAKGDGGGDDAGALRGGRRARGRFLLLRGGAGGRQGGERHKGTLTTSKGRFPPLGRLTYLKRVIDRYFNSIRRLQPVGERPEQSFIRGDATGRNRPSALSYALSYVRRARASFQPAPEGGGRPPPCKKRQVGPDFPRNPAASVHGCASKRGAE